MCPAEQREGMKKAVSKMKGGKAAGPSSIVVEMLKASCETGTETVRTGKIL